MQQSEAIEILERVGAFKRGSHFVYASGMHGTDFVDKRTLYQYPEETSRIALGIAEKFPSWGIETVIGPEHGGIIISNEVARHFSTPRNTVHAVHAKKTNPGFVISEEDLPRVQGRRILVVEDIVNSGGSLRDAIQATRAAGGIIMGASCILNRAGRTGADFEIRTFVPLIELRIDQWEEKDFPYPERPIDTVLGHGKEYMEKLAQTASK